MPTRMLPMMRSISARRILSDHCFKTRPSNGCVVTRAFSVASSGMTVFSTTGETVCAAIAKNTGSALARSVSSLRSKGVISSQALPRIRRTTRSRTRNRIALIDPSIFRLARRRISRRRSASVASSIRRIWLRMLPVRRMSPI